MPETNVERQLVVDLPNRADQCGDRMRLAKFFLVEDFGHGADDPLGWTLNNKISEGIRSLITCELAGNVEMNSSPVPPLRNDTVNGRRSPAPKDASQAKNVSLVASAPKADAKESSQHKPKPLAHQRNNNQGYWNLFAYRNDPRGFFIH